MNRLHVFLFFIFYSLNTPFFAQKSEDWALQGLVYGANYEQAIGGIYLQKKGQQVIIRQEFLNDEKDYILSEASLQTIGNSWKITENRTISQKLGTKNRSCKNVLELQPEDSMGYWRGTISSRQCRNVNYHWIAYPSTLPFNDGKENFYNNYWLTEFQNNLWKGYPSPEKVQEIRKQFKIFTIYFDYDEYDIRPDYIKKLDLMAMVIDSHSDLRIKITGHTDWDGSNVYNDSLSKERAMMVRDYFIQKGIDSSKIVIDFKGKRVPVANNSTDEGKQLNRRVILEFI